MLTLSFRHWASAALLAGGLLGSLPTLADQPPPEAASGFARITAPTAFDHAMIVTTNPLATAWLKGSGLPSAPIKRSPRAAAGAVSRPSQLCSVRLPS